MRCLTWANTITASNGSDESNIAFCRHAHIALIVLDVVVVASVTVDISAVEQDLVQRAVLVDVAAAAVYTPAGVGMVEHILVNLHLLQ